jgi:hypothetical protein
MLWLGVLLGLRRLYVLRDVLLQVLCLAPHQHRAVVPVLD